MASYFEDLLGGEAGNQGRMRAAAQRLRKRRALATLGAFTGDPVVGQWSQGELGRIEEQAKQLRAAQQAARRIQPLGADMYSQGGGPPRLLPGAQERALERIRMQQTYQFEKAARAREAALQNAKALEEWKMQQPTRSQATGARETAAYLPEIQNLVREFSDENIQIPAFTEAAAEWARASSLLPEGIRSAVASQIEEAGLTPEARAWLDRGRQTESDIIRLMSGLAVTGFELENVKKWSPWAPNISRRQRVDRMTNIYNKLGRSAAAVMGKQWKNVNVGRLSGMGGGGNGAVAAAGAQTPTTEGFEIISVEPD